jgi:acyl carrier protein
MTSSEVEGRVREVVAECVKLTPASIGAKVSFDDLGLDSVGALDLVERLEATFVITIPEEDSLRLTTVDAVTRYVARRVDRSAA